MSAKVWICEDCGWECAPNPAIPLNEAECDNCGEELTEGTESADQAASMADTDNARAYRAARGISEAEAATYRDRH